MQMSIINQHCLKLHNIIQEKDYPKINNYKTDISFVGNDISKVNQII